MRVPLSLTLPVRLKFTTTHPKREETMKIDAPLVTIREPATSRQMTTKAGAVKTIYSQRAEVETEQMRVSVELEIDDPTKAHPVGSKFYWNLTPDLVPGRFGIELARRQTLVAVQAAADKKAA